MTYILQQSCELEIRERAHAGFPRQVVQINMGCKQAMACENNKDQNFSNDNPAWTQARGGYTFKFSEIQNEIFV